MEPVWYTDYGRRTTVEYGSEDQRMDQSDRDIPVDSLPWQEPPPSLSLDDFSLSLSVTQVSYQLLLPLRPSQKYKEREREGGKGGMAKEEAY